MCRYVWPGRADTPSFWRDAVLYCGYELGSADMGAPRSSRAGCQMERGSPAMGGLGCAQRVSLCADALRLVFAESIVALSSVASCMPVGLAAGTSGSRAYALMTVSRGTARSRSR